MKIRNDLSGAIILAIMGFFLLRACFSSMSQTMRYQSTQGVFLRSESYSLGNDRTYYNWFYQYFVDGIEYHCTSMGHTTVKPAKETGMIRYDTKEPNYSYLDEHDITQGVLMLVGFLFFVPLIRYLYKKKKAWEEFKEYELPPS